MAYKKICGIYKITNLVNGKIYIGQSISIKARWCQHKSQLNKNIRENEHLQNAWNKYDEENFSFEVLEECLCEELNDKEIYWIKHYNSMNKKYGYNKTSGGCQNKKVSDETKEKLREINKDIHKGEKSERNIYPEELIKNIKIMLFNGFTPKEISEKTNIKQNYISKIKSLDKWSWLLSEYNDVIKNIDYGKCNNAKKVFMFDEYMNKINEFNSAKEASLINNINHGGISLSCLNKTIFAGGYIWLYEDENLLDNIEKKKHKLEKRKHKTKNK